MEVNTMSKMIKCKHCGQEIAKSAKVCPSCGGKNKKPFYVFTQKGHYHHMES